METENKCIQKELQSQGNTRHRSTCLRDIPSASLMHVLENGTIQQGSGCLSSKLESNLKCFPLFCSDRKDFEKGATGLRFNNNSYSNMAVTNMISRVTQNICQKPTHSSRKLGPSS